MLLHSTHPFQAGIYDHQAISASADQRSPTGRPEDVAGHGDHRTSMVNSQKSLLSITAKDQDHLSEKVDKNHTEEVFQQSIDHRATIVRNMMNNDDTACSSTGASIMRVESIERMSEEVDPPVDSPNNNQQKV